MNIKRAARVYDIFKKHFGEKEAEEVTEFLGTFSTEGLATQDRLMEVRGELKGDISDLRDELKSDISDLRDELKGDISDLRDELKGDISSMEIRLIKWMIGVNASVVAIMVALLAFLR